MIACKSCGSIYESNSKESTDHRMPCPACGSTERLILFSGGTNIEFGGSVELSGGVEVLDSAHLLLKTVVAPEHPTDRGVIIVAVALPWFEIIKILQENPGAAFEIEPRKWEEIIAGAYEKAGFDEVILTPRSGDLGRDIIAVKRGIGEIRIIDQVKAYTPPHLVTADDVRALVGVVEMDSASKGFLTTTSDFAPRLKEDPLIKPLLSNRIELINGEDLISRLVQIAER